MTGTKGIRRIEAAIEHLNEAELRWALGQCELRRKYETAFNPRNLKARSSRWYHIERRVRAALKEIELNSDK